MPVMLPCFDTTRKSDSLLCSVLKAVRSLITVLLHVWLFFLWTSCIKHKTVLTVDIHLACKNQNTRVYWLVFYSCCWIKCKVETFCFPLIHKHLWVLRGEERGLSFVISFSASRNTGTFVLVDCIFGWLWGGDHALSWVNLHLLHGRLQVSTSLFLPEVFCGTKGDGLLCLKSLAQYFTEWQLLATSSLWFTFGCIN